MKHIIVVCVDDCVMRGHVDDHEYKTLLHMWARRRKLKGVDAVDALGYFVLCEEDGSGKVETHVDLDKIIAIHELA
jgi:hypothetical protein